MNSGGGGAEQRPGGTVNSGEEEGQVKTRGIILKVWFIRKLRWGNKGRERQWEGRADKACHGA